MTLAERIRRVSDVSQAEAEYLRLLCSSWQVLADLSFSDLLLYVPVSDEAFQICAQVRPLTSQTLYPKDMVGERVTQPEQPIVERAYREGRIWFQEDPVLVDGIPIRMDAVPVSFHGKIIAVVTKEGSPATSRRPGRLEEVYLGAAERVSSMVAAGDFPYEDRPSGEWPRVGEGLFVLDGAGRASWASPNALSSLHRLGVKHNITGLFLDDLGLGGTPVQSALSSGRLLDGELVRGETFVRLRIMPLIHGGKATGAIVLARDVSELRQKDRVISVKDATIREIHHRVKNNLQTIASLLRLQGRRVSSEEARGALLESVLRISSIALVHETLSEHPSDVADFGEVARRIAQMVREGLVAPERSIEIKVAGSTGPLRAELATPLAVTLSELMHNAVEHAFPEGDGGTIAVELSRSGDEVVAVVWDDGVGLSGDPEKGTNLGLHIVRSLTQELGGTFTISSNGGTRAQVRVPSRR
ncbi:MAG: sensor histidine kinase [Actinomycetota bacterium]